MIGNYSMFTYIFVDNVRLGLGMHKNLIYLALYGFSRYLKILMV